MTLCKGLYTGMPVVNKSYRGFTKPWIITEKNRHYQNAALWWSVKEYCLGQYFGALVTCFAKDTVHAVLDFWQQVGSIFELFLENSSQMRSGLTKWHLFESCFGKHVRIFAFLADVEWWNNLWFKFMIYVNPFEILYESICTDSTIWNVQRNIPEAFLTFASKSFNGPSCAAHGPYTPCTLSAVKWRHCTPHPGHWAIQ